MKLRRCLRLQEIGRSSAVVAAAASVVVLAVGCSSSPSPGASGSGNASAKAGQLAPGGTATLRVIPYQGALDTWNPETSSTGEMWLNVYSTLLLEDPHGQLTGYLASSWTDTPTTMKFTLKKGITCSDGTHLTASDVAASLKYFFASNAFGKVPAFGPGPYTVTADDSANTVTVTLGTPDADAIWGFDDQYPGHETSIICPAGLAALKSNPNALNSAPPTYGTGPYTVSQYTPGGNVTLKLRPDFAWGPDGITSHSPGLPGTIVYQIEDDPTTEANLLQSGAVNLADVTGPDADRLRSDKSLELRALPSYQVNPMYINEAPGHPGSDIKVREALITAIDPKLYLEALGQPGTLSTSIVTPNVPCYDAATASLAPKPSVAQATRILESDGYKMSGGKLYKNGQPLTIDFPVRSGFGSAAEYMASAFEQMGATVKFQQVDPGTWITDVSSGNYDVSVLNNVLYPATVGTAAQLYDGPLPPKGFNTGRLTHWQDYLDLVSQSEAKTGSASCASLDQLQMTFWKNWDFLPLYAPTTDFFGNGVDISGLVDPNVSVFWIKVLKS
jgi:peptide/nickel transport system substrate-binding protein